MKTTILVLILALANPLAAETVFIGTGGGRNGKAMGIYRAEFNSNSGHLTAPILAAEYANPGFLVQHPSKPVLYACGLPKQPIDDGGGAVAAFKIGPGHSLEFHSEAWSHGKDPCHVAVDATGKTVAVANYDDGVIATIQLDENGYPGKVGTYLLEQGSGPHPRQTSSHAHGVYFDRSNQFLLVPDLGADLVRVLDFTPGASTFVPAPESLRTPPGAGPRHLAFSPDQKHAYVINELNSTVLVASYDGKGGFKVIETLPTLPPNVNQPNTTAEIEVSPDGRFVYASNRGHDTIVVFSRDAGSGKLTWIQHAPCGGKTPRHFKIAPGGRWLLCAHQDSNSISVLPRDPQTGLLGEAVETVSAPTPICILFVR